VAELRLKERHFTAASKPSMFDAELLYYGFLVYEMVDVTSD